MSAIKNETNYIFSHEVLKHYFFKNKKGYFKLLFKDDEQSAIKRLEIMWDYSYGVSQNNESIIKEEFTPKIKRGNIDENNFYFALELPKPQNIADCKYVGILYNEKTEESKYFTFEKSYNFNNDGIFKTLVNKVRGKIKEDTPSYILGGWESEKHLNFGEVNDTGLEGFVEVIKNKY
ncbi:MAG: hypothetical protein ACRCZ9_00245 [Fusobacteriaceae bacterium]